MAQQRYKVIERIDAGGMAEVFKANATSMQGFEKLVAIKRILPSLTQNERFVRMFLDEAKVSLHLNHTNCVHVFDLGIADETYFIVMEYVNGTNLKKLIEYLQDQKRTLPIALAVFVAIEVCKGLTHAHDKKDQNGKPLDIVHRDISPPNVLLSRAGEVKITDFGLAKAKNQAEVTDPGVVKGKFGYLSPEAAQGEEVDARTDIFAVGILLWEMLAGRRLFLGESDYDTLQLVRKTKVPDITKFRPDVPRQLVQVLKNTLTKDPSKRYQTAKALAISLAEFLYAYGEVVTNYDLAEQVTALLDQHPQRAKTAKDLAVDATIQAQLNQLKSLEEIDDLDLYMAQNYDSLPDEGQSQPDVNQHFDGNFEDPRMWADFGFGGGDPESAEALAMADVPETGENIASSEPESWQKTNLADIAHSTSAYRAVTGPPAEEDRSVTASPVPTPDAHVGHPLQPSQADSIHVAEPQTSNLPKLSPHREHIPPPASTANQSSSKLSPTLFTVLVALLVIFLGIGIYFGVTTFL